VTMSRVPMADPDIYDPDFDEPDDAVDDHDGITRPEVPDVGPA
jgi:hypothetical protein